jgi:uncharacterized protein (DUF2236 family)
VPAALPATDAELLALAGVSLEVDPAQGLFRDGCWLRRVSAEPALLFGGGRALLLEVAHPLVAAGVAQHSNFRADPYGRLKRTLDAMSALTFRDRASALATARSLARSHERIRGVTSCGTAAFPAGTPYEASDPDLVRWVWATLVETSVAVYEAFVAPLSAAALEAFYVDHAVIARLLGIPSDRVPGSWSDFRAFWEGAVSGDTLSVTADARAIAATVLDPPGGGRNARTVRLITAALLPRRLRDEFGLPWDDETAARYAALTDSVRRLRATAPGR